MRSIPENERREAAIRVKYGKPRALQSSSVWAKSGVKLTPAPGLSFAVRGAGFWEDAQGRVRRKNCSAMEPTQ